MKLKVIAILILVSASAFAESSLNDSQSIRIYRAMGPSPYAVVLPGSAPIAPDANGRGRVIWRVNIPADVGITDSCVMNGGVLFQQTSETVTTIYPLPNQPNQSPAPQTVSVRDFEVRGVAVAQQGMSCSRFPQPMHRMIQLTLAITKDDQLLRPPTPPGGPAILPAPISQYVSIAGQLFQVKLQPAAIGMSAMAQLIPMGPPPAPGL